MEQRMLEKRRDMEQRGFCRPYAQAIVATQLREERARSGKVVVKAADREWWADRMGARAKYILDHCYEDTATDEWRVFIHDIQTQSGTHRHQGGLALFALEGKGATIMNGKKYEWEKGDLILLPVVPGEVEHQHINYSGNAKWIAFIYTPFWHATATTITTVTDRKGWNGTPAQAVV